MESAWKNELLTQLVERNRREAEPFESVYNEGSHLLGENMTMAARMIEFERASTEMLYELKSKETGATLAYFTEKIRFLQDLMSRRRSEDEVRDSFSYYRGRVTEREMRLASTTDKLRTADEELSRVLDRYAAYESAIARQKVDIGIVCDENARLKAILKSRNITF
jgi:hypothetical protein